MVSSAAEAGQTDTNNLKAITKNETLYLGSLEVVNEYRG